MPVGVSVGTGVCVSECMPVYDPLPVSTPLLRECLI